MDGFKLLIVFWAIFQPLFLLSQNIGDAIDYSRVDSHAINIKYKNDIHLLTRELTSAFPDEVSKSRAIFRWITTNISYDYTFYNKYFYKGRLPTAYRCRNDEKCKAKAMAWEIKYLNKVLHSGKAVCLGYSMLFKKMCALAGIKSEIITGYVRTEYTEVGTTGWSDHAWNAVWLDSVCYLLDATWASGSCTQNEDGKLLSFSKGFDEYYWLTSPIDFARNHFPREGRWVLIPNYTKENFAANPYYSSNKLSNIKLITPNSGLITATLGDTIRFKLEYAGNIQRLQINSNMSRDPDLWKQQYIRYHRKGNVYEFTYVVQGKSLYYIDLIFDSERVMRFKVQMEEYAIPEPN